MFLLFSFRRSASPSAELDSSIPWCDFFQRRSGGSDWLGLDSNQKAIRKAMNFGPQHQLSSAHGFKIYVVVSTFLFASQITPAIVSAMIIAPVSVWSFT